jgi:hypothetical protein
MPYDSKQQSENAMWPVRISIYLMDLKSILYKLITGGVDFGQQSLTGAPAGKQVIGRLAVGQNWDLGRGCFFETKIN